MEEVIERFPYLCECIFSELDNDSLTKCREVSKGWRQAVDSQPILMMQRYTKCSRTLLRKIIQKEDLVDLANQTRKLYEKYPITSSKNTFTPLHEAAKIGNLPILELIVENHDDINCRDGYGWTPLHWAAESGHLEICQLIFPLIKEKNPKDKYGKTAFDVAFRYHHWKLCGLIIDNNQDNMADFVWKSQVWKEFMCERFDIEILWRLVNAFFEIGKLQLGEMIIEGIQENYSPEWSIAEGDSDLSQNVRTLTYLCNEQLAYSSVPNRSACTFINFEEKIHPAQSYFGRHIYWF